MFIHNVICPVSSVRIDSNVSRLTVFLNAILLTAYLITGNPILIAIVALDYGIRAIWRPEYSPLRVFANRIANHFYLPVKYVDQAPKLFASRVGFLFALTSTLLFPVSAPASVVVAGVFLIFAGMDAIFNFCVGCITYSYIVLPVYRATGMRDTA